MTRYLKQRPHGHPFLWSAELAKRPDMVEVASLDDPLPPDPRDAPSPSFFAVDVDDDPITRVSDDPPELQPVNHTPPPAPRRRKKDPLAEMLATPAAALEIDAEGQGF